MLIPGKNWHVALGSCKITLVHTNSLKNHTISSTYLSPKIPTLFSTSFQNPTLSSTEIGKNHTLAVLGQAYPSLWERPSPPGVGGQHWPSFIFRFSTRWRMVFNMFFQCRCDFFLFTEPWFLPGNKINFNKIFHFHFYYYFITTCLWNCQIDSSNMWIKS